MFLVFAALSFFEINKSEYIKNDVYKTNIL